MEPPWLARAVSTNCSTQDAGSLAVGSLMDVYNNMHLLFAPHEFNSSGYPFPNDLWLVKPAWEIAVKTLAFVPIVVGGIWGNLAVLNAVRTNRLLRAAPSNLFIANMALCDLCGLLIGPWMLMVNDSFQAYVLGGFLCKTEGFVQSSLLLGGVLSLTAVSCDRFVAIVLPRRPRLGPCAAWAVVAATWVIGIAISVPLVIYRNYHERKWCNFLERYCAENTRVLGLYWNVLIAVLVWFPLAVMLLCYTTIYIKLVRYTRSARRSPTGVAARTDMRSRVARMVLALLLVFVVCRVPFTAMVYVRNSRPSNHQISEAFRILWFVSHYLIYTNAAINPVIYGMTNEGFRSALRRPQPCRGGCEGNPQEAARPGPEPRVGKAITAPAASPRQPSAPRALQPREPYYLEPCWRPSTRPSPFFIRVTHP